MSADSQPTSPIDERAPDLFDSRRRPMHPGWLICERVSGWITTAILAPAAAVGVILALTLGDPAPWAAALFVVAWIALVAILVWSIVVYARLAYYRMSWTPCPARLEVRRGVWWRKAVTIPRSRVQHTDVMQGPLQRRYGIATLSVHTAGTQHAKVDVPGLARADAERLRDWLLGDEGPDGV